MYAPIFSWKTVTAMLFFIFFLASVDALAQDYTIHFPTEGYHTNKIIPRLDKEEIKVCGLVKGKKYILSLNPERFTKPCKKYSINGKKSTLEFTANSGCESFSLERSACSAESRIENSYFTIGCLDCHLKDGEEKMNSIETQENNNVLDLISNIFQANNCFQVIPSSIEFSGRIGTFSNGASSIEMEEGIIMSTSNPVSYTHLRAPRDRTRSRMPSSA